MKTMYVLRHGQAAPEVRSKPDYDRALTLRGEAEVASTARYLAERQRAPSLILASSALRARTTAELCANALAGPPRLELVDALYLAEPSTYLSELAARAEAHQTVMVVGHNPGLEELVLLLGSRSEHLATASLAEIELAVSSFGELSARGPSVAAARGRIVSVFRP